MVTIRSGVSLAPYTSFRVGGVAKHFVRVTNGEELQQAIAMARKESWPIFILAGGTNLIIASTGFDGLVIKVEIDSHVVSKNTIISGAGVPMAILVEQAAAANLAGLEWAGGLPGTLGGAVRGNAGAFAGEMKDIVHSVVSVDMTTGQTITRSNRQCQFSYRSSIFKLREHEVIISVLLKLRKGDSEKLRAVAQQRIQYRHDKHPMEYPSAGSVFKNVPVGQFPPQLIEKYHSHIKTDPFPVVPAARLIADAGLAGLTVGGAAVSDKHTNYIVNVGGATGEDIVEIIQRVRRKVREQFGVLLEIEPQLVGF